MYLKMLLKPVCPLEQANAFLAGVVMQPAIQRSEGQHAAEGQLALRAPRLLLVHCPVQKATCCKSEYTLVVLTQKIFKYGI